MIQQNKNREKVFNKLKLEPYFYGQMQWMYEADRREVSINYKLWRNLLPLGPSLAIILSILSNKKIH